jgi:hypothetical protein
MPLSDPFNPIVSFLHLPDLFDLISQVAPPHSGEFGAVIVALLLNFLNGSLPTLVALRKQFVGFADVFVGISYPRYELVMVRE